MTGIGAVSIRIGSAPARAKARTRARGVSPRRVAASSLVIRTAAAPSLICDELPAVTTPSGLNAGFSAARRAAVVSGRMPSSSVITMVVPSTLTGTGTSSRSNRASAVACAARCCEPSAYSSSSSRESAHFSAMSSAEMPCGTRSG